MKKDDLTRTFSADLRQILQQGMDEGKISGFGGPWSVWGAVIAPGMVSVNATRSAAVPSDPEQFSCACESMHREIPVIVELFRKFEPYRNARLAAVAPLVGVRENREAVTRHRIKFDELFVENEVTDSIALGGHPVDRHCAGTSAQNIEFLTRAYPVPYGALVVNGVENVLVAGALIGADPDAYASLRVQAQCMATGEAAGISAALGMPQASVVRAALKAVGAVIDRADIK